MKRILVHFRVFVICFIIIGSMFTVLSPKAEAAGGDPYIDMGATYTADDQYDFDSTIALYVDVDCVPGPRTVDVFTWFETPNDDTIDGASDYGWVVQGTVNDGKWFYMVLEFDYMQYVGTQWHIDVLVRDSSTFTLYDQKKIFVTIGPKLTEHFTCRDYNNPDGTGTTIFYDTDVLACEYTRWDSHNLWITWSVKYKFYGPMGEYWTSDWYNIPPGHSSTAAYAYIWIKDYAAAQNPGSWYVDVLLEDNFRARDGFDIMATTLPTLDVSLISPADGALFDTLPIELRARVTSGGSPVQSALVRFYAGGSEIGSASSDSSGYATLSYSPSAGTYNWYAKAEKSGYTEGTSSTQSFTYTPPPPPPTYYTIDLSSRTVDGQTNTGSIEFDGQTYNLPNTISKIAGTYQATAVEPDDYGFDSWEYSGSITVTNPSFRTSDVIISGDCSLTAVFKGTIVALSATVSIFEPPVLGGTVTLELNLENSGTAPISEGEYSVRLTYWDNYNEGGIDSFWVKWQGDWKGTSLAQLGAPEGYTDQFTGPALGLGDTYGPKLLMFPVPEMQAPSLVLTDEFFIEISGPDGVSTTARISDVDVGLGYSTAANVLAEVIIDVILEDIPFASLGAAVVETAIEQASQDMSRAYDAYNQGDLATAAKYAAKVAFGMGLWTPDMTLEERFNIMKKIFINYVKGPLSIADLIIWWVNFKYETYLKGFDLNAISFIESVGLTIFGPVIAIFTDPVNLLVVDPIGNRVGVDPQTGTVFNEIPGAYIYGIEEGNVEAIVLPVLAEGDYTVHCIGLFNEPYQLHLEIANETEILHDTLYTGSMEEGQVLGSTLTVKQEGPIVEVTSTEPSRFPQAYFTESTHEAPAGTAISFDASTSLDPDGEIVSYDWDFDSDGTYDATGPTTSFTYLNPGTYQVTLKVTDNQGLTNTTIALKTITPQQVIPEVPWGTVMASAMMVIALVAYFAWPKWRRKRQFN